MGQGQTILVFWEKYIFIYFQKGTTSKNKGNGQI